ncbi:MAG: hypothetical protein J1F66_00500 [Clostridiales bacterium]|nr:hypothetical protein [Clostridiales bacterium]
MILNLVLTPLCDFIVRRLSDNLGSPFITFILIIGFGFSSIFAALYFIFDRWLWQIIPGIKSKKISGQYLCDGKSNFKTSDWKGTVTIKQTWSKILISLKTDNSYSQSYMAHIDVSDDGSIYLYYCYMNAPNGNLKALHKHDGTASITFDNNSINGKYYNYPVDRPRYGTIKLIKQEK